MDWPIKVVLAHSEHGVEAVTLKGGRPVFSLPLPRGGVYVDVNGDSVIDHLSVVEKRGRPTRTTVIESDGTYFAAEAIELAANHLAGLLADQPAGFTVAEARDLFGTTRKFVLPLLAHLDRTGVTRRRDDLRIAGPRLPGAAD